MEFTSYVDVSADQVFGAMSEEEKERLLERLLLWKQGDKAKAARAGRAGVGNPLLDLIEEVDGAAVVWLAERVQLGIVTKGEAFDEVVKLVTGFAPVGGG